MNMQARSGTPKVMGILMIIFAALGLIGSLLGFGGKEEGDAWATYNTFNLIFSVVGLGVSALHLVAGLNSVRYKQSGPKLAVMYGALAIVAQIAFAVVLFVIVKPKIIAGLETGGAGAHTAEAANAVNTVLGTLLMIKVVLFSIWPIIVLAIMSRPGAKAACTN